MSVLIDTNILLRLADRDSPHHAAAQSAVRTLRHAGIELCLVPQVLYEYWVVATRPASANGLGMTVAEADRSVQMLLQDFSLRRDERGIFGRWQMLVTNHDVKGKTAHDARLVAAMQRHGLTRVLTFNTGDFARFDGIDVVSPADDLTSLGNDELPRASRRR